MRHFYKYPHEASRMQSELAGVEDFQDLVYDEVCLL